MRFRFTFLAFVLVVGVGVYSYLNRPTQNEQNKEPSTITESGSKKGTKETSRSSIQREYYQGERPKLTEAQATQFSSECLTFFNAIQSLDLGEALANGADKLPKPEGCNPVPAVFTNAHEEFQKNCYRADSTKPQNQVRCYLAAFMYRARISDWLTQETPVEDIDDPKILLDKIVLKLQTSPVEVDAYAERLISLDPNFEPGFQALFMARLLQAQSVARGMPQSPEWDRVLEARKRLEEAFGREEAEMAEVYLMTDVLRFDDFERVKDKAETLSQNRPNSGLGPYFLGWAANKKGDRAAAIEWVSEASRRQPKEARFRDTLARLQNAKQAGEVPNAFETRLSLDIVSSVVEEEPKTK